MTTADNDTLAADAAAITTAATMTSQITHAAAVLCSGLTEEGFERQRVVRQLDALANWLVTAVEWWLGVSGCEDGPLDGVLADAYGTTAYLSGTIDDLGTLLAYGEDLPDDWGGRLDDVHRRCVAVVRQVGAAMDGGGA